MPQREDMTLRQKLLGLGSALVMVAAGSNLFGYAATRLELHALHQKDPVISQRYTEEILEMRDEPNSLQKGLNYAFIYGTIFAAEQYLECNGLSEDDN